MMMCEINVKKKKEKINENKEVAVEEIKVKEIYGDKEQPENVIGSRQELLCTVVA